MNKDKLEKLALEFIGNNYGGQEQESPCYNIKMMIDYMVENYDKDNADNYVFVRHCDECVIEMWDGYCVDNGMEYYCSEECLHKHYTEEEWDEMYDEGNGDSYYTEWYEEMKEYYNLKGVEK